ncbi:hypothetical protein VNI00_014544 [Paramarasmius palmivorus]|uniref:Epoxide hydrolase N-terminal domain-containing protein n=1 Tax=Paramarasmius palmivorus TaxID=297713 RepID=A0AAW0BTI1_9AGAR
MFARMTEPQPFLVSVQPTVLQWISERLSTARIVPEINHAPTREWEDGTPVNVLAELVDFWKTTFDWREVEKELNQKFKMFTLDMEEAGEVLSVHFVHHRSPRHDALPLLFLHGWPGNFTEVEAFLELTDPTDANAQAFHVVAPSLPGFAFSSAPNNPGFGASRMAGLFHKLMNKLGYTHYIGQGNDIGSFILRSMAIQFPRSCVAIHLNYIIAMPPSPTSHPYTLFWLMLQWFTPEEKKAIDRMKQNFEKGFGYAQIQGTKPQTLSYGLMDSPIGMLAWIRDKMHDLVDPSFEWDKKMVITWVMLYLVAGNSGAFRVYKENMDQEEVKKVMDTKVPREVMFGYSHFPWDVGYITRWWAEAMVADNIVYWKEHSSGGHFASVECSDVLVKDFVEFCNLIRGDRRELLVKAGGM